MKNFFRYSMISITAVLFTAVICSAIPSSPVPPRLVNDFAGIFTADQRMALENALVAFDDSTSNQIAVVTVSDLEGYSAMEYATRIGLDWKVGGAEHNNGLVLLIKPKTSSSGGDVAISVGYGLEGAIPDAYAKRVIENELIPHFRENDYFGGTAAACSVLMKLASGEISEPREAEGNDSSAIIPIIMFFCLIAFIAAISSKNGRGGNGGGRRNTYSRGDDIADAIIIGSILGSGRHSGGSSWGGSGGFGGGFGGFGGGSFGGGGASGSW